METPLDKQPHGWDIEKLWVHYEHVTMHFNDLLMRLRTQALAAVAALSTLVGIFVNTDIANLRADWQIAMFVFAALAAFWVAIWILDFAYYNRLLIGAVDALIELETESKSSRCAGAIQLSTIVENVMARSRPPRTRSWREAFWLQIGRWTFYVMVFGVLSAGFLYSRSMYLSLPTPAPATKAFVPDF
jgi:hypothetical protein